MAPKPPAKPPPKGKPVPPKPGYFRNPFKKKEPPKTPISGFGERMRNAFLNNYRGVIGSIVPLLALSWQSEKYNHAKTVELMWLMVLWFYITQPVSIPSAGLVPVFLLPMSGSMSTIATCGCYMTENIILYILATMLLLTLNNSGVDRRLALWFLCAGGTCQFSEKRLIFKVSSAAFFLSMFSSRLIATYTLTQIVTNGFIKLEAAAPKGPDEPKLLAVRNVINNAIQTSSGIGSIAVLHSSFATMLFRGCFQEFAPKGREYPDIFNYLQYSAFAFPVAFFMFIFNVIYHMLLSNWVNRHRMGTVRMEELRVIFRRVKAEIPRKISLHERLSVIATIVYMCMFFFRWNQWIEGWGDYRRDTESPLIPRIKDATTASIFVILLHTIPKGYGFLRFIDAEKKSELPPLKPESAILWWRFVDRNVNYGYLFTFGCSFALAKSSVVTGLDTIIAENMGTGITGKGWNGGIFIVILIATILPNVMTACAACGIWLPFVLCMSTDAALPWPGKIYIAALGVGVAASFGFCIPFQYTPAYFCHHTGKVPIKSMIKYSIFSVILCLIILYVALLYWAPYLFDREDYGILTELAPVAPGATTTTTEAGPPSEE